MRLRGDWPEFALSWRQGAAHWEASFQESADARAALENVPAGKLVLRLRGEGQHQDRMNEWPVLAEIELAPGNHKFVVIE